MKERPILFSGAMVRAIRAGRKTQTRRVVKPQPTAATRVAHVALMPPRDDGTFEELWWDHVGSTAGRVPRSPYGQAGDRLWVRETWASPETNIKRPGRVAYDADGMCGAFIGDGGGGLIWLTHGRILEASGYRECFPANGADTCGLGKFGGRWRPSIHMPRWASRTTLNVTGVRIERLQDISEADAEAEGLRAAHFQVKWIAGASFVDAYRTLWDKINGKRPGRTWADNPWVWVVTFDPPAAAQ